MQILITCKANTINRDNMVNRKSAAGAFVLAVRGSSHRLWGAYVDQALVRRFDQPPGGHKGGNR